MNIVLQVCIVVTVAFITYNFYIPCFQCTSIDQYDFRGKSVLITGGSRNIGAELAYQFARRHASIMVTARNATSLQKVVARCKQLGATSAHYVVADMSKMEDTDTVVQETVRVLGKLDFLFINHVTGLESLNLSRWSGTKLDAHNLKFAKRATQVNFLSYVFLASLAQPYLEESNGYLNVVSSLAGLIPSPNVSFYGATKAAVNHFFNTWYMEMDFYSDSFSFSITISSLGPIDTVIEGPCTYKYNLDRYNVSQTVIELIEATINRQFHVIIPKKFIVPVCIFTTIPIRLRNFIYSYVLR